MKAIFTLALFLLPFLTTSQTNTTTLTLKQIISLFNKDYSEINDYLMARGWDFEESEKETSEDYGSVTWAIRNNKNSFGAMGFFEISYSERVGNVRARYQCSTQETFKNLRTEATSFKMQKVKSGMYNDGNIYTDYLGENYAIRFESGKGEYNNLVYQIHLYKKDRYFRTRYND